MIADYNNHADWFARVERTDAGRVMKSVLASNSCECSMIMVFRSLSGQVLMNLVSWEDISAGRVRLARQVGYTCACVFDHRRRTL
jgi:hypothetical protein